MQTFLPSSNFDTCALVLDPKRLGNQYYREGLTLLRTQPGMGWSNHPAFRMWYGHRWHLCQYLAACDRELQRRGHDYPDHRGWLRAYTMHYWKRESRMPWWLHDPLLHATHRSNLLRKDPEWYGQFGWTEPDWLPYYWPEADDPQDPADQEMGLASLLALGGNPTAPAGAVDP